MVFVKSNQLTLLAMVLSSSMLAACGGGSSGSSSDNDDTTPVVDSGGDGSSDNNSDNNNDDGGTPTNGSLAVLQGDWVRECFVDDGDRSGKTDLTVSGNTFTQINHTFTDTSCAMPEMTFEIQGLLSVQGEKTLSSGQTGIKLLTPNITFMVTLHREEFVQGMNVASSCGTSNWAIGKPVNATNCELFQTAVEEFDKGAVYVVDGDLLYGGDEDSLAADGYPSQLDDSPFKRVN